MKGGGTGGTGRAGRLEGNRKALILLLLGAQQADRRVFIKLRPFPIALFTQMPSVPMMYTFPASTGVTSLALLLASTRRRNNRHLF